MQKILLLSLSIILLSSCSYGKTINKEVTNSGTVVVEKIQLTEEEEKALKIQQKKEKIQTLRKKLALRGLIRKGDVSLKNGEYTTALVRYLQIIKDIPNDLSTIQKIGNTYFNLNKFKQAFSYYKKANEYERLNRDKAAIALISSMNINQENIIIINQELQELKLSEEQYFYYSNSISCVIDYSLCKKHFQDYFENVIKEGYNQEGTGALEEVEEIRFEKLYNIEKALTTYENFQVDDLLYKGALVSGAFYENGLYPVAIETSKSVLENREDYKPLLKLIAKSYYELGNYIESKQYLIKYNKLTKEDSEASYFLGVIYEKLHEYILSTIHFNKSLKTGYEGKLDIKKRILFNYYELGEMDKMLSIFKEIIEGYSDELGVDDYSLAIYYYIVNDKITEAKEFSKEAISKFPDSEVLNGYMGWILMAEVNKLPEIMEISGDTVELEKEILENRYSEAESFINKGLEINTNSPMLNLVKGKIEGSKGNINKAFIYFKKTVSLDNNGDFGKIAKQELENIKTNR